MTLEHFTTPQSHAPSTQATPLIFGIYPGGAASGEPSDSSATGPADDPERILAALKQLQPAERPFIVRGYLLYIGAQTIQHATPANVAQYVADRRQLDLVLCYRTPDGDLGDWDAFVRSIVCQYGPALGMLQITEEPNNPNAATGGDGSFPNVQQAIVRGVLAAKEEMRRQGYSFQVGFNATPSFNTDFWNQLAAIADTDFIAALDYVGFDFFPDVFRPLPSAPDGAPMTLEAAVAGVLRGFRTISLAAANIPAAVPIHITEHGWPTNPQRSEERQAQVLEAVVRTINELRAELNITHYEYFSLRDDDSTNPGFQGLQFGLLHDDYTPKPAFERYQAIIAELG